MGSLVWPHLPHLPVACSCKHISCVLKSLWSPCWKPRRSQKGIGVAPVPSGSATWGPTLERHLVKSAPPARPSSRQTLKNTHFICVVSPPHVGVLLQSPLGGRLPDSDPSAPTALFSQADSCGSCTPKRRGLWHWDQTPFLPQVSSTKTISVESPAGLQSSLPQPTASRDRLQGQTPSLLLPPQLPLSLTWSSEWGWGHTLPAWVPLTPLHLLSLHFFISYAPFLGPFPLIPPVLCGAQAFNLYLYHFNWGSEALLCIRITWIDYENTYICPFFNPYKTGI